MDINITSSIDDMSDITVTTDHTIDLNGLVISTTTDLVNHPQHYTSHPSGIECIEITQHYNFCVGNAIKYLWRNGLKNDISLSNKEIKLQDLKKAVWYINREISNLENNIYE